MAKHKALPSGAAVLMAMATAMVVFAATGVSAAELRGRLWDAQRSKQAPDGAALNVRCGDVSRGPLPLTGNGSYSVRDLPNGKSCQLTVTIAGKTSRAVAFRTDKTVVRLNGEVRNMPNGVVVLTR